MAVDCAMKLCIALKLPVQKKIFLPIAMPSVLASNQGSNSNIKAN
jgi:hypothetical protein